MKHFVTKLFSILLLCSAAPLLADCDTDCATSCDSQTTSCYQNRSQSRYKMRQVVGMRGKSHDIQHEMDEDFWGHFSLNLGYHQTFRSKDIARCLFNGDLVDGCGCDRAIKIQGREVEDRDAKAWLADYFYLPRDYDSTVTFKPEIKNVIFDLDWYFGLDKWQEGMYLRIHAPLVHTRWNLNMCERINDAGSAPHVEGYFTTAALPRTDLLDSFEQYANGMAPIDTTATTNGDTGDVDTVNFQSLKCAKMSRCEQKETGLAEVRFELGWNFVQNEDYHVGIAFAAAAPTGNRCCPEYLFNAVAGNGKHWEVGAVGTGHYIFWRNEEMNKHAGFYVDANVMHQINRGGRRTFDLKNKPNSKYMLASRFVPNDDDQLEGSGINEDPFRQFGFEYAPVANISTVYVDVKTSIHADVIAWFNYSTERCSFDLGYNLYAHSCEEICKKDCPPCDGKSSVCEPTNIDRWTLKGDARMIGFEDNSTPARPLSATQSNATIHSGTELETNGSAIALDADNHTNAHADNNALTTWDSTILRTSSNNNTTQVRTSIQPVYISCCDVDLAGSKSISHALFAHLNYTMESESSWEKYIGVGGMVEFGSNTDCDDVNDSDCDSCMRCTPSYWGLWVKGGIFFD